MGKINDNVLIEKNKIPIINKISQKYKCDIISTQDNTELKLYIKKHTFYIEIEEINSRWWSENFKKPTFPSGLIIEPFIKIIPFIQNNKKLKNYVEKNYASIINISELAEIMNDKNIKPKKGKIKKLLIKTNCNATHLCIITQKVITDSLNYCLKDQNYINEKIEFQRKFSYLKKAGFEFYKNIWLNPKGKNTKGALYNSRLFLILGGIKPDNDLIWVKNENVCDVLDKLIF
jgi:hypothetical protein